MFQVHPVSAVIATLDSALGYLTNNQAQIKEEVLDALKHRIHLRQQLLTDMDRKPDEYNSDSGSGWKVSAELTDTLAAGHQLASPVDWAWSMSVQRKLASQVPPRQIVKFEFEKAIETLKGMCSDIVSLVRILDNWSPGNLMVCSSFIRTYWSGRRIDRISGIFLQFHAAQAHASTIYPITIVMFIQQKWRSCGEAEQRRICLRGFDTSCQPNRCINGPSSDK